MPEEDGDKDNGGRVLVVAGCREFPGAALLAGTAALRAGAGTLTLATPATIAPGIGLAMLEARVIALPETEQGGVSVQAALMLADVAARSDAILIGPGMQDARASCDFVRALVQRIDKAQVVLDALAMDAVRDPQQLVKASVAITPCAGEMAHLHGESKSAVLEDSSGAVCGAAAQWNAVVVLKGRTTLIAAPDGRLWRHEGGGIGLAACGSSDTLSGLIAGLVARGASLEQACVWAVVLHARAGERLAARYGPLGYLAREIADEIPGLLRRMQPAPPESRLSPFPGADEDGSPRMSLW